MLLKELIYKKKTRLCFSADFKTKEKLFYWIELLGPHICILKTHIDILEDFDESVIEKLLFYKKKFNFYILEDRKFSDIGKTFRNQLYCGIYKIASWADIITIHGISAYGMLNQLDELAPKVLIVSQMSSENNLIDKNYSIKCYNLAKQFNKLVIGFISQNKFVDDNNFLFLTPGVKILDMTQTAEKEADQNYRSPKQALKNDRNDIIIVGSGIYSNKKNINEYIEQYKYFRLLH